MKKVIGYDANGSAVFEVSKKKHKTQNDFEAIEVKKASKNRSKKQSEAEAEAKKKAEAEKREAMQALASKVEAYLNGKSEEEEEAEDLKRLYQLAYIITFSILNKIDNKTSSRVMTEYRTNLIKDIKSFDAIDTMLDESEESLILLEEAYRDIMKKASSEAEEVIQSIEASYKDSKARIKRDCSVEESKIIKYDLSEAYDLVQEAILSLLQQAKKAKEENREFSLFEPMEVKKSSKKIAIKLEDTSYEAEYEEKSPFQLAFRSARLGIEKDRSARHQTTEYNYIIRTYSEAEKAEAEEKSFELPYYFRLPKYIDLEAEEESYQKLLDYQYAMEAMKLTDKQAKILMLRLQGHGLKAIATYLGIKRGSVQKHLKLIGVKYEKLMEESKK